MIIEFTVRADDPSKLLEVAGEFARGVADKGPGDPGTIHTKPWGPATPVNFIAAGTVGTGAKSATKWQATFRAAWGPDVDYDMVMPLDAPCCHEVNSRGV